jgi:hypothetical protein
MQKVINNQLSETVKAVIMIAALCLMLNSSNAQTPLQVNTVTQKAGCHISIPFSGPLTKEAAFEIVEKNMIANPRLFTRSNDLYTTNALGNNNKNFMELEQEFANAAPVQSVDPEGKRIAARVMFKYYSPATSRCLKLMYVQYYIVVTVTDNSLEIEVTDIRYNHFNKKNYQLMRITNWSDYTSCDPISTIEYLIQNENCHADFNAFAAFFNTNTNQLKTQIAAFVEGGSSLTLN